MYRLLFGLILLFNAAGCSTVPVSVNMAQNHPGLNLNTERDKFSFQVGLVMLDPFSDFILKSSVKNINIEYNFEYHLGDDFSETLPEFFKKRFDQATILSSPDKSEIFDYVFMPDLSSSWLTIIAKIKNTAPSYSLQIHLGITVNKQGGKYAETTIKEYIEKDTEIACWTCFGEQILNQAKIREEYAFLLAKVYASLDAYLNNLIKGEIK
jgi:hypothetical protein